MDLIEIIRIVKQKEKLRDKLLGQKELLLVSLNDLGFKSVISAEKALKKEKEELKKMKDYYEKGRATFIKKYAHLLER